MDTYKYAVVTHGVSHDQGHWTGHNDRDEAERCAIRVKGSLYKIIWDRSRKNKYSYHMKYIPIDRDKKVDIWYD